MKYRNACAKPCGDCPFRRKSAAGWLGEATPSSFVIAISYETPLPCHQTIDYTDRKWLEKWTAQRIGMICTGSLIMMANMCKLPRDPAFPRMKADRTNVFARPEEFITYHEDAEVRSWESDEAHEIRAKRAKA